MFYAETLSYDYFLSGSRLKKFCRCSLTKDGLKIPQMIQKDHTARDQLSTELLYSTARKEMNIEEEVSVQYQNECSQPRNSKIQYIELLTVRKGMWFAIPGSVYRVTYKLKSNCNNCNLIQIKTSFKYNKWPFEPDIDRNELKVCKKFNNYYQCNKFIKISNGNKLVSVDGQIYLEFECYKEQEAPRQTNWTVVFNYKSL